MISEAKVERAVEYIRIHAERLGQLIGLCKSLEQKRKVIHGQEFLKATGTVAEREARAYASDEFRAVVEEIENAWAEKATVETMMKSAELKIEVWRSQFSKYGKGHV